MAALFVAVKDSDYFNRTYGVALDTRESNSITPESRGTHSEWNESCHNKSCPGRCGPSTDATRRDKCDSDLLCWIPLAACRIDKGTPIKILSPVDTEGSALVVLPDAPVTDRNFHILGKARGLQPVSR